MAVYWDAVENDWDEEENALNDEMSLRETQDEGVARQRAYEEEVERDRHNSLESTITLDDLDMLDFYGRSGKLKLL